MTTMQKFKAYFGMVPPSDYEDDYIEDEPGAGRRHREEAYRDEYYGGESYQDGAYHDGAYREETYRAGYRESEGGREDRYGDEREFVERVTYSERERFDGRGGDEFVPRPGGRHAHEVGERRGPQRLEPLQRSAGATLRVTHTATGRTGEENEMGQMFADGPLQKITTLRPTDYSEARTIGERFRDGSPVIMDLVEMSNDDAKRLVDFAAGLAFALRGSFDKVATKVFLLSPADIDVSPEDRRKIAETGFYNQS